MCFCILTVEFNFVRTLGCLALIFDCCNKQSTCSGGDVCTARYLEHCGSLSAVGFQYGFWQFVLLLKLVRIFKVFFLNTDSMIRRGFVSNAT
jgi:hypothetical protein